MFLFRRVLSFLLAPVVNAVVFSGLWFLDGPESSLSLADNLLWLPVMALVGGVAVLVLGVPALLLFRWRGWTSASAYALGGGVIGVVVYLCISEGAYLWSPALKSVVSAAVASLVFRSLGGWASNNSLKRTDGLRPSAA